MDLDALRYGNFSQLGEAITDWEQMVKKLADLKKDAEDNLKKKADKADWKGANASVSRQFIAKTVAEFTDAHTQAKSIARILRDTRGELVSYRTQLNDVISRASKQHLSVFDTGQGSFRVTANTRPDFATDPSGNSGATDQKVVTGFRDEIQDILTKATQSDKSAAKVLRLLVDQAKYGFNGASYKNRDEAAGAVAAADQAAKILAKNPHDVTKTELSALNSTLAKYKKDPLFAEEFATQVGPKKVLTFWAGIADPYQATYGPGRSDVAKELQKNLGITLGQATLSDSAEMKAWEKRIIKLGPDQLGIDDASNPTGYAVMSNLMRFGDYDDQFLTSYGENLLAYDKKVNGEGINPWVNNVNQGDLNYWDYKNDRGRDPVTGFLEALGHNPGASQDFFGRPDITQYGMLDRDPVDKDSEINGHLKYLTQERVWSTDTTLAGKDDYVAGRAALGHALESATTGRPYDATPQEIKDGGEARTPAAAAVMEQVAYVFGSSEDGPKMLHDHPEMAKSLGRMAGAYIDDINYYLSGVGEHALDESSFPPAYEGRANFTEDGAIKFLSVLGQNEDSHAAVNASQHLYMLNALDKYPATSDVNLDHAHDVMVVGAEARGILDHARVEQAAADFTKDSEEANKSLGRSADWYGWGAGTLVGLGVAAIPVPGSTAMAVAIAPAVQDSAGEMVNTFIGHEIDDVVEGKEEDPAEQAQMSSQEFYRKGSRQLGDVYSTYIGEGSRVSDELDREDWGQDINNSYYGTGSNIGDRRGHGPHKED
jgi:hypothetical protein